MLTKAVGALGVAVAVGLSTTACGSTSVSSTPTPTNSPSATAAPSTPATPAATTATTATTVPVTTTVKKVAHVGSTVEVSMATNGLNDAKADVTLEKVIDPATADQYTQAPAGDRLVAAEFQITAKGVLSDDANNDASLVGSNNQTYTPGFDTIPACTNFNSGQVTLATGASSTGCVVFEVPKAVTTTQINFGDQAGTIGQWQVP